MKDLQPAFPCEDHGLLGMTLRDYFAAKAMWMKFGASNQSLELEQMAKVCYQMADAMMEAREK